MPAGKRRPEIDVDTDSAIDDGGRDGSDTGSGLKPESGTQVAGRNAFGLSMGAKARANMARRTGQRELLDFIAQQKERPCNVERIRDWGAEQCDCEHVITFTLTDGRVVRSCGVPEHMKMLGNIAKS
jgi:hypothetical protein